MKAQRVSSHLELGRGLGRMDLMRLDAGEAEESLSYLQFQSSLLYTDRTYDNKERRRGEDSGGKGEQGRGRRRDQPCSWWVVYFQHAEV